MHRATIPCILLLCRPDLSRAVRDLDRVGTTTQAPPGRVDDPAVEPRVPAEQNRSQGMVQPVTLSTMSGKTYMRDHQTQTEQFAALLDFLALDLRRLDTFQRVNPLLFANRFANHAMEGMGMYAWRGSILAFSFVDLHFGGVLSSAIALAAGGITDVAEEWMRDMRRSQMQLIEKGKDADLAYLTDVSFGLLNGDYADVRAVPAEVLDQQTRELARHDGGTLAGRYLQVHNRKEAKVAKFGVAGGLFVGGFFTGGVTWAIGGALGVADYAGTVTASELAKSAASKKLKLLLGLARLRDKSAWDDAGEECTITGGAGDGGPCATVEAHYDGDGQSSPAPGTGVLIRRRCSRGSMWGHHADKVPEGEISPVGRCLPTRLPQLPNGVPCHADSSCASSYCHFEPRLQYFASDHPRKVPDGMQVDLESQLRALSEVVPAPADPADREQVRAEMDRFLRSYDSLDGAAFATTGTCASACPLEEVGSSDCTHPGHLGAFGLRRPGTVTVTVTAKDPPGGAPGQPVRFDKVGDGACYVVDNTMHRKKTLPKYASATFPEGGDLIKACAQLCANEGKSSFVVRHSDRTCHVSLGRPYDAAVRDNKPGDDSSECYDMALPAPIDAYQPWSEPWADYRKQIRQVLGELEIEQRRPEALRKVQEAYGDYGTDEKLGNVSPPNWDAGIAKDVLTRVAPLSAQGLQQLFTRVATTLQLMGAS